VAQQPQVALEVVAEVAQVAVVAAKEV